MFCCLHCLHLVRTKNKLESYKDTKKVKFNQDHKCGKEAAIIFEDCESLVQENDWCKQ